MPVFLDVPASISCSVEAHNKWMLLVRQAEQLVEEDVRIQEAAAKALRLKTRNLPPEVVGRTYALYVDLLNKMYHAYLNSVHLQRATYMLEIIGVFMKRIFELRNELVHIIVNDYIYVDRALVQLKLTPYDIQIIVPYHLPLECRPNSMEQMLQKMWKDAERRKKRPPKPKKPKPPPPPQPSVPGINEDLDVDILGEGGTEPAPVQPPPVEVVEEEEEEEISIAPSVHTIIPEEFIHMCLIQRMERFRQYYMRAFFNKCQIRRTFFKNKDLEEAPLELKTRAAAFIKRVCREFMRLKRKQVDDTRRDIILGILPDPYKSRLHYDEENRMMYARRRREREKIQDPYVRETARESERLIFCRKDGQCEDITEQIYTWFQEWYYGYGFFPDFPYEVDGGTIVVMTGQYPTIEEKIEEDEKWTKATKGKTKEQLKTEKLNAKRDAELRAEVLREKEKAEAEKLFKLRCDPFGDPGYQIQRSDIMSDLRDTLRKYRMTWSIYDTIPPEVCAETIYGYLKPVITDDLMYQMHKECRLYVDQLMRLEERLLIKAQQAMYSRMGWKWPKFKPRPRPTILPVPNEFIVDDAMYKSFDRVFDLGLITKPTSKINDIIGDMNYAAYDLNIQDPDATYPAPSYGDIRRRLLLSCVFGSGVEPNAKKNKAVMLVGPAKNGKSFLVDCVAGEMNAVKIDISPAVLSSKVKGVGRILTRAFTAARVFQPAVIFCRDIDKVFCKKVQPEDRKLKARSMKRPLTKVLKTMLPEDKVIFIATCTYPKTAKVRPMVKLFTEIILVPRADYGSVRLFFYEKFQKIRILPRDYCMQIQPLAQLLQGYGFGFIMKLYDDIMTDERIVRLKETPLSPAEFIEPLIDNNIDPVTTADFQEYIDFCLNYGPLKAERMEYNVINSVRKEVYRSAAERAAKNAQKAGQGA